MSCRFPVLGAVVVVLLEACGSSGTNSLFGAGASTGGQVNANTGGVATGATTGAGGAGDVTSGGAGLSGAGSGGTGVPDSGGSSGGGASDSGAASSTPLDASSLVTVFVAGGIITQQCSSCAQTNCQKEEAACQADPECMKIYSCVTSCFIPLQCAACVVGSGSGPQNFNTFECCTSHHCSGLGLCPSLNAGVIGCP